MNRYLTWVNISLHFTLCCQHHLVQGGHSSALLNLPLIALGWCVPECTKDSHPSLRGAQHSSCLKEVGQKRLYYS